MNNSSWQYRIQQFMTVLRSDKTKRRFLIARLVYLFFYWQYLTLLFSELVPKGILGCAITTLMAGGLALTAVICVREYEFFRKSENDPIGRKLKIWKSCLRLYTIGIVFLSISVGYEYRPYTVILTFVMIGVNLIFLVIDIRSILIAQKQKAEKN